MAQYRIADPEELMECPYDRVHMVRAKRFQYHLMKCRQNYKGKDFVSCPFNAKHEMPRPEMRHHISVCPDKAMIEPELTYAARKENGDSNMHKGCTDTPVYKELAIPSNEDWDSEAADCVGVGPLHDRSYFGRVQFHDTTNMNKAQRKVMKDNRLTPEQKMTELALQAGKGVNEDEDMLRLPKTSSIAAMPRQPQIQPREQPVSSVFQYSVGRGRGRGRGMATANDELPSAGLQYGRGYAMAAQTVPVGIGRGLMAGGGIGRGKVNPPPGFCVPNVNSNE